VGFGSKDSAEKGKELIYNRDPVVTKVLGGKGACSGSAREKISL
jgi:hypothetical protein